MERVSENPYIGRFHMFPRSWTNMEIHIHKSQRGFTYSSPLKIAVGIKLSFDLKTYAQLAYYGLKQYTNHQFYNNFQIIQNTIFFNLDLGTNGKNLKITRLCSKRNHTASEWGPFGLVFNSDLGRHKH